MLCRRGRIIAGDFSRFFLFVRVRERRGGVSVIRNQVLKMSPINNPRRNRVTTCNFIEMSKSGFFRPPDRVYFKRNYGDISMWTVMLSAEFVLSPLKQLMTQLVFVVYRLRIIWNVNGPILAFRFQPVFLTNFLKWLKLSFVFLGVFCFTQWFLNVPVLRRSATYLCGFMKLTKSQAYTSW